MVASFIVAAAAMAGYGQGLIEPANFLNTGVNLNVGTGGNPVYSSLVTENGLIFTTDPTEQAGNLGGPIGSQLIGKDFSWALYGASSPYSTFTLLASETGSQIAGDNINWGQFSDGSSVTVPGTQANSIVYLELYVWEGDAYASFEEAAASGDATGDSGVFANPSGGGGEPGYTLTGMPDIEVGLVPEPGTLALLAVGGGALLLLGRRNRG